MNPKQALPGLRIAIGGGAFLAPYTTSRIFGLDPTDNNEAIFLGRLFGIRDVALGIGQMSSGDDNALWWQLGVICDLGDALAAVIGLRSGLPKRAGVMSALTALAAAGMGIAALNSSGSSTE
jgi:hypothetical protein